MRNSKALFQEIVSDIKLKESRDEITGIGYILLETLFGVSRTDVMRGKMVPYSRAAAVGLQSALGRINRGEPVQYVVGAEYFFGRKFFVNPSVLIPRPETEELVRTVLHFSNSPMRADKPLPVRILDIGTGSGCISITLYLGISGAEIFATDVSPAALSVATRNAEQLGTRITFIEHDVLREKIPFSNLDVIVSNPPYVMEKEKSEMRSNVLDHEPHGALFVPDTDPLIFYKEIVTQAAEILKPGGLLAMEINEKFGKDVAQLLVSAGFRDVSIVKDVASKDRVVKGIKH